MAIIEGKKKGEEKPGANDVLEQAKAYFEQQVGRKMTQQELDWLTSGRGDRGTVSAVDATKAYIGGLNTLSQRILSDAVNVYGMKNFTVEQANKVRDSLYIAGDQESYKTLNDRIKATLDRMAHEEQANPTVGADDQTKYNGTVSEIFQRDLGRDPTKGELDHFSKQLAQGDDAYLLESAIKMSEEYQNKVAGEQRSKLGDELLGYQQQAFEKAQPSIIASYMKAGRLNSSGLNSSLALAAKELEGQRQQYLSGISREDYVNNRAKAFDIYNTNALPSYQRAQALGQMGYTIPYQNGANILARGNEINDYERQQNDFNRYQQQARDAQRGSSLYGLYGTLFGSGIQGAAAYYGYKKYGY